MAVVKKLVACYGACGYGAYAAGSCKLYGRAALGNGAGGVDLQSSIRRAGYDRRSGSKPGCRGNLGKNKTGNVTGLLDLRQHIGGNTGKLAKLRDPAARVIIAEHRAHRFDRVGAEIPGYAVANIVLGKINTACAFDNFRLVFTQPHHLRQGPCRTYGVYGAFSEQLGVVFLQKLCLRAASCVRPVYESAQRLIVCVAEHGHVRCGINGQRRYRFAVDPGLFDACLDIYYDCIEKIIGILLEPAGLRRICRIFARGCSKHIALRIYKRCLGG